MKAYIYSYIAVVGKAMASGSYVSKLKKKATKCRGKDEDSRALTSLGDSCLVKFSTPHNKHANTRTTIECSTEARHLT